MQILGTAASGLRAQQLALDTVSNNIANVNTVGFKSQEVDFAETLTTQLRPANTVLPNGQVVPNAINVGAGVLYNSTGTDFQPGMVVGTGVSTDIAIDGDGFFQVSLPDGQTAYTRAGNFRLDGSGQLVDPQGNPLMPVIKVPAGMSKLTISPNGEVRGTNAHGTEQTLGQITLATFPNPESLLNTGDNLYVPSAATGPVQTGAPGSPVAGQPGQPYPGNLGLLRGEALEQSNVDLAKAMTDMIEVQRAYQLNARMIQDGDQMWALANTMK